MNGGERHPKHPVLLNGQSRRALHQNHAGCLVLSCLVAMGRQRWRLPFPFLEGNKTIFVTLRLAFFIFCLCFLFSGYLVLPAGRLRTGGREVREGAARCEVYRGGEGGGESAGQLGNCESVTQHSTLASSFCMVEGGGGLQCRRQAK